MAIDKSAVKAFAKRWDGIGYEKGDTQQYWLQLLRALGYAHSDDVKFEHHLPGGGFIDVWIRDAGVLVEQKSIEIDLDKPEPRRGKLKTPLEQAMDYVVDLPLPEQPRFIITCNFKQFRIYDREKYGSSELADNAFEFTLEELANRPEYLNIIVDPNNSRLEKEKQVSIEAGRLIGQLYDLMRAGYINPESEESQHALNVLCVRLVFCLYCEDSDLFPKDSFFNFLKDVPAQNIRTNLKRLFKALDTPVKERDPYDVSLKGFPYVNGGLFKNETEIPNFSEETKDFLLNKVSSPVNWSQISPTIFGGIFESTLNPETRRKGGMHYTSPENIHKVIDPLFLDDLKEEFNSIRADEELTPRQKKNRYRNFHQKLCSLKFLDPAAGSGNFLTETYLCLRKLEDSVLVELRGGQTAFGFDEDDDKGTRVSLNQFYGIEINDFAVTVAEAALWISRLKANGEESMILSASDDFPLHERANIVHGNALRIDWNEVVPASECTYIMGNPPFIGHQWRTASQQEDMDLLFNQIHGYGKLDYVCAWYKKGIDYFGAYPIRCAFVSTNSICQGESVSVFWKYMKSENVGIDFAYTTFVWNSEASVQAHVHVVIIGFSRETGVFKPKKLFDSNNNCQIVDHINGYLYPVDDVFIDNRGQSVNSGLPILTKGSQETGGNNLIMSAEEREYLLNKYPQLSTVIRPYCGSREFLNGGVRYCLWFTDDNYKNFSDISEIRDRLEAVKQFRLTSKTESVRQDANTPWKFTQIRQPETNYIFVPRVSSGRRKYVPLDFVSKEIIITSDANLIATNSLFIFALLSSQMHNAWLSVVGGRMKSDFRYSPSVYNSFVFPQTTKIQCEAIEKLAQNILDIRKKYHENTLAELYDPEKMPADLLSAHKDLDKAVEEAYGVNFEGDEEKIVAHLFKLYSDKVSKLVEGR